MKNYFSTILTAATLLSLCSCADNAQQRQYSDREIMYADPTIFVDNDRYLLTGTRNIEPLGFAILESTDLKSWSTPNDSSLQMILKKGESTFGEVGFWAPQIFRSAEEYHLTYTANEQTVIAKSQSVDGLYKQEIVAPIDGEEKNIDSYIFKDDDGKHYLYHVRFDKGNYLWVAEFDLSSGKIDSETLTKCFDATEQWEQTPNYKSAPVMEGPTVIKRNGVYYMFYSANHFKNIDYAVGYATSSSPMGPWVKSKNNPIIHRSIVGENGSGHGDLFKGVDDKYYYVYHVHHSDTVVAPRRTRIVEVNFKENPTTGVDDVSVDVNSIIIPLQM